ncbi:MAG: hypothetical protein ACK5MA_05310 [Parachlamydiaceae bacterium]
MSLEGLRKFNEGYGFPLHRNPEDSKLMLIFARITAAIPFFGLRGIEPRTNPAESSRIILASTIVGLPIIFALDIIATLFTQPIGRALEKRRVRNLALAEM